MNEADRQVDEAINLTNLMRTFLVGKDMPVVMETLCMLMAETISVRGSPEMVDKKVDFVGVCIRECIKEIKGMPNDAA